MKKMFIRVYTKRNKKKISNKQTGVFTKAIVGLRIKKYQRN